ncbi:hypothetical protein GGD66_005669 [Bradyrhizobium sp. CIR48]|uniref:hypothetical protein n=1 Tax=Bradyrhizobium sp. CIR48 TaxID=2663840 RepID=UPI0016067007|nr:hypothetical protein [Bradyrhizobium sp. CIR48]MBB4427093.1 hypothetical protein [Bradyrhizobium sp. CIR48]
MHFDQLNVLHELRRLSAKGDKATAQSLRRHLGSNGGLDPHLRPVLIALLGSEGWRGLRLVLKRRRGRISTEAHHAGNISAYEFYQDLLTRPMTREIARRYAAAIGAEPVQVERLQKETRYELKITGTVYLIKMGTKETRLRKDRRIPKGVALVLTSEKFGRPKETVRKWLRQMDALQSGQ